MCGRIGRERKRESAVRERLIALSNSMPGAICEKALGVFRLGEKNKIKGDHEEQKGIH